MSGPWAVVHRSQEAAEAAVDVVVPEAVAESDRADLADELRPEPWLSFIALGGDERGPAVLVGVTRDDVQVPAHGPRGTPVAVFRHGGFHAL